MHLRHKQRGMSVLTGFFILVVLAIFGLVGLRLLPIYLESFKVDKALAGIIEEPNVASQTKQQIALSIVRRLDIDGSTLIKFDNWKEFVDIDKVREKVTIKVKWRKEAPLFANLGLIADFQKEVTNLP